MSGQAAEGSSLILAHQSRVACHVSGKYCRQSPLDPVPLPIHETLGAFPERIVRLAGRGVQPTMSNASKAKLR
jgi:hypothetical protein